MSGAADPVSRGAAYAFHGDKAGGGESAESREWGTAITDTDTDTDTAAGIPDVNPFYLRQTTRPIPRSHQLRRLLVRPVPPGPNTHIDEPRAE